ncbi:MAG: response regulator [Ignavibacteria bacterium]|nr:response regulator [Ignavibacteria bacterium]
MSQEIKHQYKILIIDDNPLELGLIRLVIQKNFPELKTFTLTKPPDWSSFFQNQDIDAIIIDYRLPEKNGLEVIKDLRNFNKEVPTYLITALERDEIEQDIIKSGATDLIVKDRSYSNLVSKINDLILKRSFEKFEQELNSLKYILNTLSNLLVLKIDETENCIEVLGGYKDLPQLSSSVMFNDGWKKYFYEIFSEQKKELSTLSQNITEKKSFQITIDNSVNKINALLLKSTYYYLILQF